MTNQQRMDKMHPVYDHQPERKAPKNTPYIFHVRKKCISRLRVFDWLFFSWKVERTKKRKEIAAQKREEEKL
jgi:hypothetical protein